MTARKFSSYVSGWGRAVGLAILAGAAAVSMLAGGRGSAVAAGRGPAFVPGEVLVHFKSAATDAERRGALSRAAVDQVRGHLRTEAMRDSGDTGFHQVHTRAAVADAVRALQADPAVDYAQPNWIYTTDAVSNDPYYTGGNLWGMYSASSSPANQYGSGAADAWANGSTGSSTVYVGVIDQGIQYTHPDLAANIWTNPYDPADGLDNDSNGYIDDLHGWNFFGGNNQIYSAVDGDGHGTHVAGTIGAVGGNSLGVAGVNWNVQIISGKFIGPTGGSTSDAVRAIDYMTNLKVKHLLNLVALNNSWGGGGYDQALLDAITRAAKQNILFIAAAGNAASNTDITPNYPSIYDTTLGTSTESGAGYNSVVAVAAIDYNGALAGFSNYGATTVHLGAPGVGINSTYPTDSYLALNGTSMATPHVTGAVALYASLHPGVAANDIRTALLSSVVPTASLSGKTSTGGRLNIPNLLNVSAPAPAPAPAPVPAPAPAPAPSVTSISPNAMSSGSSISATISGANFQAGATVTFTNGSQSQPQASSVVVSNSGAISLVISTARNKGGHARYWTVVVTNPDGQSAQLVNGFVVR